MSMKYSNYGVTSMRQIHITQGTVITTCIHREEAFAEDEVVAKRFTIKRPQIRSEGSISNTRTLQNQYVATYAYVGGILVPIAQWIIKEITYVRNVDWETTITRTIWLKPKP